MLLRSSWLKGGGPENAKVSEKVSTGHCRATEGKIAREDVSDESKSEKWKGGRQIKHSRGKGLPGRGVNISNGREVRTAQQVWDVKNKSMLLKCEVHGTEGGYFPNKNSGYMAPMRWNVPNQECLRKYQR